MELLFSEEFLRIWLIASISLGCWTCLTQLANQQGEPFVRYAIVFLISLLMVPQTSAYTAIVLDHPVQWMTDLSKVLTWVYGPLLVFILHKTFRKKRDIHYLWLHFIPFLIIIANLFLGFVDYNVHMYLFLLCAQVLAYGLYGGKKIFLHRAVLKNLMQHHSSTYYWLIFLTAGLFFLMCMDIVIVTRLMLGLNTSTETTVLIGSGVAFYINIVALLSVYRPQLRDEPKENKQPDTLIKQPRSLELSQTAAKDLDHKLNALILEYKPHLDADISLSKLASLLGVTTYQLSELLNVYKETGFYDFLNELRYQESLALLTDSNMSLSITDVAYRAGFNNRNSFYRVFKEKTGETPSQYKKRALAG